MNAALNAPPKIWLNLILCKSIYENFRQQVKFQEPLKEFETRYPGRLEAILGAVSQSFDDTYLYPTVLEAAAAYYYKINCLHPFENGNKRMCILYTDAFLFFHDLELTLSHKQMYDLALFVAQASREYQLKPDNVHSLCMLIISDHVKPRNQSLVSVIAQYIPEGLKKRLKRSK